jgi:phage terminase large subunit-like protein
VSSSAQAALLDAEGLGNYRYWKPEYQERAADLLNRRRLTPYKPFYCTRKGCGGHAHVKPDTSEPCADEWGHVWARMEAWTCVHCGANGEPEDEWLFEHARPDQRPPNWHRDWLTWVMMGGRGSGKTRSGSEVTHRITEKVGRIILIAPTGHDLRETMVEGVSGLQATAAPGKYPDWEPSKKKLTWPNGCIGLGFSAEEPDRLRGPASGFIWADEPAHYPDTQAVWDNMLFGHREKGELEPKIVATSTPKPTEWMRELVKKASTIVHRVSSYANLANLSDSFKRNVLEPYEGSRIGRQELHGEILEDVEGALWTWGMFSAVPEAPDLVRTVVAVDPAGSTNKRSDLTGIVVVGIDAEGVLYVLADYSGKFSPEQWSRKVAIAVEEFGADTIVAEKNYGGEMVKSTLHNADVWARVELVDSRRGKELRAEPVVALYEKGRVKHVGPRGYLTKLEEEQTSWVPGEGASPNRVDALVHAATKLAKPKRKSQGADPRRVLEGLTSPISTYLSGARR